MRTVPLRDTSRGVPRGVQATFIAITFGCVVIVSAQSLTGVATKINVIDESSAANVGKNAQLLLELLDPKSNPARADKDFVIDVKGHTLTGNVESSQVTIKRGESSGTVELPLKHSGPFRVDASNRELVTGGAIINVRPAAGSGSERLPSVTPSPSATPSSSTLGLAPFSGTAMFQRDFSSRLAGSTGSGGGHVTAAPPPPPFRPQASPSRRLIAGGGAPSVATRSPASARADVAESIWIPSVTFMYYPERKFAANKKDLATIYAMLDSNDRAISDLSLNLMSRDGPATIVIPHGQDHGQAQISSDEPGVMEVRFLSSSPPVKDTAGMPIKISFAPAIAGLAIRANPPRIGLFESTEIAVQFVNADGLGTPTDEIRDVWLAVDSGSGEFDTTKLQIRPNEYRATTTFRPIWPGSVRLVAGSSELREVATDLTVLRPTLILVLCGIGGLAGGVIAFWSEKARWTRIPTGFVTGFVLYWLLVFGLVKASLIPHVVVFNPFSAAVITLLGGWSGTQVLAFALKQTGIEWTKNLLTKQ